MGEEKKRIVVEESNDGSFVATFSGPITIRDLRHMQRSTELGFRRLSFERKMKRATMVSPLVTKGTIGAENAKS